MKTKTTPAPPHTPLPWENSGYAVHKTSIREVIAQANSYANAAYIAKCVNAHEELIAACEMAFSYFGENIRNSPSQIAAKLAEAIAKAEGK